MSNPAQEDAEILIPDWVVAYYDRAEPEVYESSAARISYLLRATAQRVTDVSSAWLEPFGLTGLAFNVLAFLRAAEDRAMSLSAISRSLHTRPATITSLIDSLERNGWVERNAHPRDRRTTLAKLTPKGATLVERASREHHRQISLLMGDIGEPARETLIRLLLDVNAGVSRVKAERKAERRAS